MVDIGSYAANQLRQAKRNRIAFGNAPKYLQVALNLEGRYFAPLSGKSKITVAHNRKADVKSKTFANSFNDATDFYGEFTRESADAASRGVTNLTRDFGTTNVPLLKAGRLVVDPLDGHSSHVKSRFGIPIEIYDKAGLKTFVSLGGT